MPAISVIVPCYNAERYLADTLDSIIQQEPQPQEIICVNDSSQDNTAQILDQYAATHPDLISVLHNQSNQGVSFSRNRGIEQATSQWLCFVDSDDLMLPGAIACLEKSIDQNPTVGLFYCNYYEQRASDISTRREARKLKVSMKNPLPCLTFRNCISLLPIVINRKWLERVNMFDCEIRSTEDYDLWLRLAHAGCEFHYITQPLGIYCRQPDSCSTNRIPMIEGHLYSLEKTLSSADELFDLLTPMEINSSRIHIRLKLTYYLLRKNEVEQAKPILEACWEIGKKDLLIWKLRLRLLGRNFEKRSTNRIIKKYFDAYKRRTHLLARKVVNDSSD